MDSLFTTEDGSYSFYSALYQENYHSKIGARTESYHKFIYPSEVLKLKKCKVIDIGFGLGYNSLILIEECKKLGIGIDIYALEYQEETLKQAGMIHQGYSLSVINSLLEKGFFQDHLIFIRLFLGDARIKLLEINANWADCVFLDPFSPPKNTELWTLEFFKKISNALTTDGKILTYSASLPVISALIKAGFYVGYTPPVGRKRGGIIASKKNTDILYPLSELDLYLLNVSTFGIPNIDKNLWAREKIKTYREKLINWSKEKQLLLSYKKALKIYDN